MSLRYEKLVLRFPGDQIGPQRFDVVGFQHIAPRRHVALAVRHRVDETRVFIAWKSAKIDCPWRIGHAIAVTRRAVSRVELSAFFDLLRWKFSAGVLRDSARTRERQHDTARTQTSHTVSTIASIGHQRKRPHRTAGGYAVRDEAAGNAAAAAR